MEQKGFVPILYRVPAFGAFDDFNALWNQLITISSKPVNHVVRIHAGEPSSSLGPQEAVFPTSVFSVGQLGVPPLEHTGWQLSD